MATGTLSARWSKYWHATTDTSGANALAKGTGSWKSSAASRYTCALNGANFESIRNISGLSFTGFKIGVKARSYGTSRNTDLSFRICTGMTNSSVSYSTSITGVVTCIDNTKVSSSTWHYFTQNDLPELLTWMNSNKKNLFNGYTSGSFAIRLNGVYFYVDDLLFDVNYKYSVAVSGVTLSSSSLSLKVGNTSTLTATVTPSNADNKSVTWSTSKSSVATVSNGVVTAVGKGTANITATTVDGGYTATCSVTVTQPVTGVSLNTQSLNLNIGSTSTLTATISPSNANNKNVTWSSNNTSVATVSNGTVTAVSSGTATITVTTVDGGYTATCTVTVQSSGMSNIKVGSSGVKKIYIGSTEIKKVYLGTIEIYSNG